MTADAPATDSPLGFLAALVDQLLAGSAIPNATAPALPLDPGTDSEAAIAVPGIIDPLLKLQASLPAGTTATGSDLLAALTRQLDALKDQLDAGQPPDPDLLKQLGQTADALAALLAAPPPPLAATPAIATPAALDPLLAIGIPPSAPTIPATPAPAAPAAPLPDGEPAPVFASLVTSPLPDADAPVATTPPQPVPALAELAQKLTSLGQSIAAMAPDVAQRLEFLGTKIDAAIASPQLLAQLLPPGADPAGTSLDSIVRSLLDAKPVLQSQPAQLAATTLPIPPPPAPAPKAADDAKPDLDVKPSTGGSATAPSAKLSLAVKSPTAAMADTAPKPDTKLALATDPAPAKPDAPAAAPDASAIAAPASSAPTATRAIPAAYQAAQNPINMGQVAFEMVRQIHQGNSRFSIRLDPPELGRVDVKMHVDAAGAVTARLTVERSETLDMFQRDRGALEKALGQAGLDSGKTNLEFSLKQNPFAGMTGGGQQQQQGGNAGARFALSRDEDSPVPSVTLYRGAVSSGGVNLFV